MAWWEWGNPQGRHVVLCVHGLTRQGRDFDVLAQALLALGGDELRIVCPDVAGRGRSAWLSDPSLYQIPVYAGDMLVLLAQLHATAAMTELDWVGTSMGGLIGMAVAGQSQWPLPVPLRRLVLNDVGPAIEWSAVERMQAYLGQTGRFQTLQEAADAMWAVSQSFGPHTAEQWLSLSRPMVRSLPDGALTLHYDPAIAVPARALTREAAQQGEQLLWQLYDALQAQTLLLRGEVSDLLTVSTAQAMGVRGPRARLVEFAGVGHAPTLVASGQVDVVTQFLLS